MAGRDILWENSLIANEMKIVPEKSQEKKPRRSTEHPSAWELGGLSIVQLGLHALDDNMNEVDFQFYDDWLQACLVVHIVH